MRFFDWMLDGVFMVLFLLAVVLFTLLVGT